MRKSINDQLEKLGRSKLWLAKQMDLRPATIYDFLSGNGGMTADRLETIFGLLGLEVQPKGK